MFLKPRGGLQAIASIGKVSPLFPLFARLKIFLFAWLLASMATGAEPPPGPEPDPLAGLSPELLALLNGTKKWMTSVGATAAFGYKDNILLGETAPEGSTFVRYGAEVFASHLPRGATDYSGILSAEQTRYLTTTAVRDEANVLGIATWRYVPDGPWKFTFDARGGYFDVAYDVSDTAVQRTVAPQKWLSGTVGPTLRWTPMRWGWIEVQALGTRAVYRDHSNDGKDGMGGARIGWTPGEHVELSIGATQMLRRYDRRTAFSLGGQPLATLLEIEEREAEARLDVTWDRKGRWKTVTRFGGLEFADRQTGYYNFRRRSARQRLDWKGDSWRVIVNGTARRADYENQTVGIGVNPPPRVKDDFEIEVAVERKLSARWTLLASYRWERSRTNEPLSSYRMNEGLLGARWSWEK